MQSYFQGSFSRGFVSLYVGRSIITIGSGLFGIFLPIFLYEFFKGNFAAVVAYFGVGSFFYAVFVAWGAQFLNRFGFRRALWISTLFGAAFYGLFSFLNTNNWIIIIPLTILALLLFRITYWLPYEVNFAKFTERKNRGKEISILTATLDVIHVLLPFVAGFMISFLGYNALFLFAVFIFFISVIPYLTMPSTNESFSWSYLHTWRQLFSKKRRGVELAFFADGAESMIGAVVWPIFIFGLLEGNYLEVGVVSTLILTITVVAQLFVGRYIDEGLEKEKKVLEYGSLLYALGWILKVFVATAFHVFLAGSYHNLTRIFTRIPFDALAYDIAADQGHYVDEFTVLHEMAIHLGRTFMMGIVICLSLFFPIQWTFLFAALATILFNLLYKKKKISQQV